MSRKTMAGQLLTWDHQDRLNAPCARGNCRDAGAIIPASMTSKKTVEAMRVVATCLQRVVPL
ncbi:hypothetical protein KCP70_08010 [Salmonella enterica subsp. enterica]|nr:hypothetical protein KCP70_08010 [Salmonella enterica subsp. enterica]